MMNDTVREELKPKITPGFPPRVDSKPASMPVRPGLPASRTIPAPAMAKRHVTAGLGAQKTSPTLVEFQRKNTSLPDWRLQLQNAVQQRKGGHAPVSSQSNGETQYPTAGGAALNAEVVSRTYVEAEAVKGVADPLVARAMERIAESRKAFLEPDVKPKKPAQARPFGVVSPNNSATAAAAAPAKAQTIVHTPPKLVDPAPAVIKRDTNKLPAIEMSADPRSITKQDTVVKVDSGSLAPELAEIMRIQIKAEPRADEIHEIDDVYDDEIEDLAPFSMRFGAGLFDLIIGGFAAMLLISPLAFTNESWFTSAGLLTFAAAWAIVTFLYMTVCLGFFGKTMGMRLFSLELVDAIENEYPTLHQAAISSSVFLFSIGLGGVGFLTAYFNEENRALHDLASGTIIVREF